MRVGSKNGVKPSTGWVVFEVGAEPIKAGKSCLGREEVAASGVGKWLGCEQCKERWGIGKKMAAKGNKWGNGARMGVKRSTRSKGADQRLGLTACREDEKVPKLQFTDIQAGKE